MNIFKEIKNGIVVFIHEYPFVSAIGFLLKGTILLIYQLGKKESFKTSEHNLLLWQGFIGTWVVILMSFIYEVIILFKNVL